MSDKLKWPGFGPADLLVPRNCDMSKWSVVACDQYTSQPEYWKRVDAAIGDAPSSRKLILPEAFLSDGHTLEHSREVNQTMKEYLADGILECYPDALIYVERWLAGGKLRRGLVGAIDLECYDYNGSAETIIRATEGTVLSRIPPRVAVRRDAELELAHVMLLLDDPEKRVIEHLTYETEDMERVYDFDLMEQGGHITGYLLNEEQKAEVRELLMAADDQQLFEEKYDAKGEPILLYAVGDGNHSLATAKAVYQEKKEGSPEIDWSEHPARYAMVELVNLHDESLEFEAIHRVCFSVKPEEVLQTLIEYYPGTHYGPGEGHSFRYVWERGEGVITIPNPASQLTVASLQGFLDYFLTLKGVEGSYVDYVHGEDVAVELGRQPGNLAFLLPAMGKEELFRSVVHDGALPRKTFSMGEAHDKRFYLEARKIK